MYQIKGGTLLNSVKQLGRDYITTFQVEKHLSALWFLSLHVSSLKMMSI